MLLQGHSLLSIFLGFRKKKSPLLAGINMCGVSASTLQIAASLGGVMPALPRTKAAVRFRLSRGTPGVVVSPWGKGTVSAPKDEL